MHMHTHIYIYTDLRTYTKAYAHTYLLIQTSCFTTVDLQCSFHLLYLHGYTWRTLTSALSPPFLSVTYSSIFILQICFGWLAGGCTRLETEMVESYIIEQPQLYQLQLPVSLVGSSSQRVDEQLTSWPGAIVCAQGQLQRQASEQECSKVQLHSSACSWFMTRRQLNQLKLLLIANQQSIVYKCIVK